MKNMHLLLLSRCMYNYRISYTCMRQHRHVHICHTECMATCTCITSDACMLIMNMSCNTHACITIYVIQLCMHRHTLAAAVCCMLHIWLLTIACIMNIHMYDIYICFSYYKIAILSSAYTTTAMMLHSCICIVNCFRTCMCACP